MMNGTMMITVKVSDAQVSADPGETLVTHSLGSCIGVMIYDPVRRCGGLLHYQLPTSTLDAAKALAFPHMVADTGMRELLRAFEDRGGQRRHSRVRIAGAAEMFDDKGVFSIGKRNHSAIRKILWQLGLLLAAEDVGGVTPRTVYFRIADGAVTIKAGAATREL